MNNINSKKRKRRVNPLQAATGFAAGLIMVLAGVYFATLTPVGPLPNALPYMNSSEKVQVTVSRYAFSQPVNPSFRTGIIFYPGGRVDYRSYAPLAFRLAEKGWPVAVIPMPLNLAVLGSDRAAWAITDHPEISHWVIGGHSLGGTMAVKYLTENPSDFSGIIFLAAYPQRKELVGLSLPVLSIAASEDGLITPKEWETYRERFPTGTRWITINGGNHAGFGWYGTQEGDNPSVISLEDQTNQVVQAVDQFMHNIDNTD